MSVFNQVLTEAEVVDLPSPSGYIGYMVIRPQARGVVGRTMLRPTPALRAAVRTGVKERVILFGQELTVRAVPFVQQDSRLGSCAHAAAWMTHYSAFRAQRGVGRKAIGAFTQAVDAGLSAGRAVPSTGLTLQQLSKMLTSMGLFPIYYDVETLGTADRPVEWPVIATSDVRASGAAGKRACCRYLNSGLPVLGVVRIWRPGDTLSNRHAIVICGYERRKTSPRDVDLVVNDDRRGPYLRMESLDEDVDVESGEHYRCDQLLIPAPEKLWMSAEVAERNGCIRLLASARWAASAGYDGGQLTLDLHSQQQLTVRTYAIDASRFKQRVRDRYTDPVVRREYPLARFPHYIWVVEAIDRRAREVGRERAETAADIACVLGEVICDATSDDLDPSILAIRLPGLLSLPKPGDPDWGSECGTDLQYSGGQYHP